MQIRFDGPPEHVSGRFIEVEDDRGRSIKVGEWRQDGVDWLLIIPGESKGKGASDSIGEKLDEIIAICQMGTGRGGIRELENSIVKLAHEIDNQLEDRLCPSQDANGECNTLNEALSRAEDAERRLESALRIQSHLRRERQDAEAEARRLRGELVEGHQVMRTAPRRIRTLQNQLHALHEEFRTASARLNYVANWLTNTYAKNTEDARCARLYAEEAKEVLDRGLDWLVMRNRNRGRGVMESTVASKSAGEGSSPSARAIQNDTELCMLCTLSTSGKVGCAYDGMDGERIWEMITRLLSELALSDNVVGNCNTQRAILNLTWHYRKVA